MGATRKITYASMQAGTTPGSTYSSAETWGALKNENADVAAKSSGFKAVTKEGKIELTHDSVTLPEGDFSIYFVLDKNNSGSDDRIDALVDAFMKQF